MTSSSAAVMVLDHYPSEAEVDELTQFHLEQFDADYAEATAQIVRKAPDFLCTSEQDQINAHIRDGGKNCYVLVVYMEETEPFDTDDEDEDEPFDA